MAEEVKVLNIYEKLNYVQSNLKVPKNRRASFGGKAGYNYRSCEDILEAVKPLTNVARLCLRLNDNIRVENGLTFVEATAILNDCDSEACITSKGLAQIATDKKGMDVAHMTGSASSYARKYALNGLFAIDDSEDIDSMDHSEKKTNTKAAKPTSAAQEEPKEEAAPGIISTAQAKRMYAISGGDAELCKKVIARYGYKSSKEVKWEDYEAICDEIVEARGEK
jgi:hypothetical protein